MAHGNFADFIGICILAIGCVSIFLQDRRTRRRAFGAFESTFFVFQFSLDVF